MPTISLFHNDLESLLDRSITPEELDQWLPLVKGELKDYTSSNGEFRVELQDSNRPDLWCVEGIARQFRIFLTKTLASYPFVSTKQRSKHKITVSPGMEHVRPYVAACTAIGYKVTEEGLDQFIQTQEKLADIYGHQRRTVSVGLYRLNPVQFPVTYGLVKPQEARFTPLGFDEKMTLQEILAVHPKGLEHGAILSGLDQFPLLWDKDGQVLSFPPIINSRDIGEVHVGDTDLLVEVTGTDLRMVILTLNIFAMNLADRGATVGTVDIVYPYDTDLGKTLHTPCDPNHFRRIPIREIETALGLPLGAEAIRESLVAYGYQVKASRHHVSVRLPPYRNDLLHSMDVAEDVAISRGYDSFTPMMPSHFTVGSLSQLETCSDHMRDLMVGFGFQEIFSNILMSQEDLLDRMNLSNSDHTQIVEIDNVMTQSFSCLRSWMIPSLLRVEAASPRAFYPHRLFEIGEVACPDFARELGSRTSIKLGALIAHSTANFSEIHTFLDLLLYYLVCPYSLEPTKHPSFLEGRVGRILSQGQSLGLIGELHPEVLESWQVNMPVGIFELDVDSLLEIG